MTTYPYQRIADTLREEIKNGQWAAGGRLDSRTRLAERFGVSEMTVHNAIAELEREGWLLRRQGKGVFVLDWDHDAPVPACRTPADSDALARVMELEEQVVQSVSEIMTRLDNIEQRLS